MERHAAWFPTSAVLKLGVFIVSLGLIAPRAWASSNANSTKVERLLDQADDQAQHLTRDTNRMAGLIRSDVGWQALAGELNSVRFHVNDLGKLISNLQSPKVGALQWQKQSIGRIDSLLCKVALNTTDEINFLNRNQAFPYSKQYTILANQSAGMSHEISGIMMDIIRYGKDKGQLAHLSNALNLPARTNG